MAEKVAVSPCLKESLVALSGALTQGKGHGAIGVSRFDGGEQGSEPLVGEMTVLAALEDEGAESQLVALFAGREDVLLGEAVAVAMGISRADTAVETVVLADIADLNEAADVDGVAVDHQPLGHGLFGQVGGGLGGAAVYEGDVVGVGQALSRRQLIDTGKEISHGELPSPRSRRS